MLREGTATCGVFLNNNVRPLFSIDTHCWVPDWRRRPAPPLPVFVVVAKPLGIDSERGVHVHIRVAFQGISPVT